MKRKFAIVGFAAAVAIAGTGMAGAEAQAAGSTLQVRVAASYINRDTGAATQNTNIRRPSRCNAPDRYDERQIISLPGSITNNVHNDACLLDRNGAKVDDGATYESYGVGNISACPDPDDAGPKVAILDAGPTGVAATRCRQSGFQEKGVAGDKEFHARLNSERPGTQTVIWCYDEAQNGCFDDNIQDTIVIDWKRP